MYALITMSLTQPLMAAPRTWEAKDTLYAGLSALAGAMAGLSIGAFGGYALANKIESYEEEVQRGGRIALVMAGGAVGSHLGATAGVMIYGAGQGFDGFIGPSRARC